MQKIMRVFCLAAFAAVLAIGYSACFFAAMDSDGGWSGPGYAPSPGGMENTDEFDEIIEQDFVSAAEKPESYFSLNINTASYAVIRRNINSGAKIYKDQVLIEEMLNYFAFDYPVPGDGEVLTLSGSLTPCPWNDSAHLLSIGVKTEAVEMGDIDNNLVFLIDVSGSMDYYDRLGLVQEAFKLLADQLNRDDRVSIVTYASGVSVALDGAMGYEKTGFAALLRIWPRADQPRARAASRKPTKSPPSITRKTATTASFWRRTGILTSAFPRRANLIILFPKKETPAFT